MRKYLTSFSFNSKKYENMLDDPKSKWGVFFDRIIMFLVIIFPFALIFESIWTNSVVFSKHLFFFEAFISWVFALEYFYRLYNSKDKISFIYNPMRIIELLSFLPFFLGFVAVWNFLKTLRILRVLRILRLMRRIPLTAGFIKSLRDYADEYRAVFTIYFIILFLGSFFVYFVEKDIVWTNFKTIPDALWRGLVTTTTVWYWDMAPVSTLWKSVWSILVFLWPLLWWLISAVTVMVFMETSASQERKKEHIRWKLCLKCKNKNSRLANYCMYCWEEYIKN